MYILLICYILFLLVYIGMNAYIIFRVNSIRVKNDLTQLGIAIYIVAVATVILVCFMFIGTLDWHLALY